MYFNVTNIAFNCIDRADPSTPYFNGGLLDKYQAIINFYFQKGTFIALNQGITPTLSISGNTITDITTYSSGQTQEDFTKDLSIGETIVLPGGGSTFEGGVVITGLTPPINSTGSTISFTGTLASGDIDSHVWVSSLITSFDFLYNLLPTGTTTPDFTSLTDSGMQKYIISTSTGSFKIGTPSNAWVTDALTGNVSQCTIAAGDITNDYKQPFTITQLFFVAPFSLPNQIRNFQQKQAPGYFPLTYAYGINGYYTSPPIVNAYISDVTSNGTGYWANQNNSGTVPEFSVGSVNYLDNTSGLAIPALDFKKTNLVTITINSASGLFSTSGNKIILTHIYASLAGPDYQNTQTTLRQNFMNDRAIGTIGGASINGEYYGTNYSVFNNVQFTYVNANTCTITCTVQYASFLQDILKLKGSNNRNYMLFATVETTTGNRVTVLCDFNVLQYDQRDGTLFSLVDYFHFHPYPQLTGDGLQSCAGMEGDPFFVKIPFRIQTAPINGVIPSLNKVVVSIVAVKTGADDFVLESRTFFTSTACVYKGVQQINVMGTKGYVTYPGDPFNSANLYNNSRLNSGTMIGYELQYGFVPRYDYWNNMQNGSPLGQQCGADIDNDILKVNNSWSNLQQNGWQLVLRFQADVEGYDGYTTSFVAESLLSINPIGVNDTGLQYVAQTVIYDDSITPGTIIPSIKKGGVSRIRTIFTFNGSPTTGNGAYFGSIFMDIPGIGGVNIRKFASSEIPSEDDSPFTATANLNPIGIDTLDQYAHGNARIGWYKRGPLYGTVIIETNYNDAGINWSNTIAPVPVVRLGFKPVPEAIASDPDGTAIESEDGFIISPND